MIATATDRSLKRMSRAAGELYAAIFLLAPVGFLIGKSPITGLGEGESATFAILQNEQLFRLGMLAEVGVVIIELVLAALLFALFRPVSRSLALGAALTRAAEATIQAVNLVPSFIALSAATGTGVYAEMSASGRETVVLASMAAYEFGILVWGIPFALHVLFLGLLVARSGLMPKVIGWLLIAASAGYFLDSLAPVVLPGAAGVAETLVMVLAIPAELSFAVWLIVKGVRAERWRELAAESDGLRADALVGSRADVATSVEA
ncbi:DUF4386 domain-containing protein [Demequina sp. NBRC 110056]|uniref:DUF4386 domain-containing protein n=1 Tax=Demequina sp. NBRC 110056 TaxID=1570345 RepID=UPI000A03477F|nr:DUF4386 domain-containing protein [Demequina sp. NBRC 110056]